MAGLHQVKPSHLDTVKCAISHPYAWERLTLGHFGPYQAPIQIVNSPKITISLAKTLPTWEAYVRLDIPTWKVSSVPHYTPMHVKA